MSSYASIPSPVYPTTPTPTPTPVVIESPNHNFSVDGKEIVIRIIKYILEGLMVGIAVALIPKSKPSMEEILTISLVSAATFSLLDMFAPSISSAARQGSGLGIGLNLVGGVPIR